MRIKFGVQKVTSPIDGNLMVDLVENISLINIIY